ncbi:hypothetical protein ONE63_011449 [Megalurothrips usitatus]|uniref:Uncharacterized protein n=1 Tax=Megalurothrips usitatus TaxID=439358 RepID=A0AAV7X5N5_9NEOP|nr:hypothetical protein ONE63_011449 [Megalurothrips usitatus]
MPVDENLFYRKKSEFVPVIPADPDDSDGSSEGEESKSQAISAISETADESDKSECRWPRPKVFEDKVIPPSSDEDKSQHEEITSTIRKKRITKFCTVDRYASSRRCANKENTSEINTSANNTPCTPSHTQRLFAEQQCNGSNNLMDCRTPTSSRSNFHLSSCEKKSSSPFTVFTSSPNVSTEQKETDLKIVGLSPVAKEYPPFLVASEVEESQFDAEVLKTKERSLAGSAARAKAREHSGSKKGPSGKLVKKTEGQVTESSTGISGSILEGALGIDESQMDSDVSKSTYKRLSKYLSSWSDSTDANNNEIELTNTDDKEPKQEADSTKQSKIPLSETLSKEREKPLVDDTGIEGDCFKGTSKDVNQFSFTQVVSASCVTDRETSEKSASVTSDQKRNPTFTSAKMKSNFSSGTMSLGAKAGKHSGSKKGPSGKLVKRTEGQVTESSTGISGCILEGALGIDESQMDSDVSKSTNKRSSKYLSSWSDSTDANNNEIELTNADDKEPNQEADSTKQSKIPQPQQKQIKKNKKTKNSSVHV